MSAGYQLVCVECGECYRPTAELLVCPSCAAAQEIAGAIRGVLEVEFEHLPSAFPSQLEMADWRDWLPLASEFPSSGLPVGGTPLLPVPRLRRELGLSRLWVKDDTRNPSASTKDRASWLVCQKAIEYGCDTVATASTGNAAAALAAQCAAFGLTCRLFVPASAPRAKLDQMRAFGAHLQTVDGDYDTAFEACIRACNEHGWYNRNTAQNPYTIEGKKTLGLEMAAQLSPDMPDLVLVSSGDGVILHGLARAFQDLLRAGLIQKLPRLLAVQSEASDALCRAWERGDPAAARIDQAHSVADSLNVCVPRDAYGAMRALEDCGGACIRVGDEAILNAVGRLARATGLFAEAAGATALAGCLQARELGLLDPDERIVLAITGSGLKDPGAARDCFRPA